MREREEEIRNINRGMHQVNEIYKDLAHIVGSQQEDIDNIENQMEESKVNADSGLQQVEKANEKFGSGNCVISWRDGTLVMFQTDRKQDILSKSGLYSYKQFFFERHHL